MRRSFILICLAILLSFCLKAQTQTPPEITYTNVATKYAPGFPANVQVWVGSNGYIDDLCKVSYTIKKDGRAIGNIADYGTVSYRIRLDGTHYTDWTPVVNGSGLITQEVVVPNTGSRIVVESFTLGIFEHVCVNRNRPIEFLATFDVVGQYTIDVNIAQVEAVAPYVFEVGSFYCLGDNVNQHTDRIALTSTMVDESIATAHIDVNVVPSYAVRFEGLGAENTLTVDAPAHKDSVMWGDDYVFSIGTMECQSGIRSVIVDGNTLTAQNGKYTIPDVREDKLVKVVFEASQYTISNGGDSHIIVPASPVNCGENAVVTIRPENDYVIATLTDNGNPVDVATLVNNTYTITNVQANHNIAATYTRVELPTLSFGQVNDKYAPGFPAEVTASINSHGYMDKLCMVEYVVTRNGEPVANISDYGSVEFSVRLQGSQPITKQLTAGSGIVNESVEYLGHTYEMNAFTASIFDNSSCLNRWRPITFVAAFNEIGNYEVTVNLYKAIVDHPELQVNAMGTSYINSCTGVTGYDSIAMNARKGELLTTLSQSVNVVPSYKITFEGLVEGNTYTAYAPARNDSVMQGDNYTFSITRVGCQSDIARVSVDGYELIPSDGKYTITNVRSDKTVNVEFTTSSFNVTASVDGEGGTATVAQSSVECGHSTVVTIRPAANYDVATVMDGSNDVTNSLVNNTYTVENVTAARNITVTFRQLSTPTVSFENIADKYSPGFPADVTARVNSHGAFNQLCKVGYVIKYNGEVIQNISDYGTVSLSVRLAQGYNDFVMDLTDGQGFVSQDVDYDGGTLSIDAFSVGIFDNYECLQRTRPISFHATFNRLGTYEVTVKLYEATENAQTLVDTIQEFESVCGLGMVYDRIALGTGEGVVYDSMTQTINVVPSYNIAFEGLIEGNTYTSYAPARNDSIMQGDDFVFSFGPLVNCQNSITNVSVDGVTLNPDNEGKYTIANVQENKTVTVTFASQVYVVSAEVEGGNGNVTPGSNSIDCGDNAVIRITPDDNYTLATITDNLVDVTGSVVDNTYTINDVRDNHQIVVTFQTLDHPTITFEDVADKYAPGFPANVTARVNSHGDFDRLCKVGYSVKRNGEVIRNISEFGTVSLSVRLAQGYDNFTMDLTEGQGFVEQQVEYQPEGSTQSQTFHIDAFSIGIFDNYPCLQRDRPVSFHATFNQPGTYEVVVKLYEAIEGAQTVVETVNHVDNVCGLGRTYYDRIAVNAETGSVIDSLTQVVNVVPSYAIIFNGLAEGNEVSLADVNLDRVKLDSIMEGEDYKFKVSLVAGCQDEVSRVTANGNIIVPDANNVYTIADVREDLTIDVAFSAHSYTVQVASTGNGHAEADAQIVTCGDDVVVTITPDRNNSIASVFDGGADVTSQLDREHNTYTITSISDNHNIIVTFTPDALPTITFEPLANEKYAPNFPVEATARINSHGSYDRMCMVGYTIKRNGRVVNNISDFGSVSYSVRLAGDRPITRELTAGDGFVQETVDYQPEGESQSQTYRINAFSVGIFDNYECLNRNRPIDFIASFTEIGYYEVTVNLYDAIYDEQYLTNINAYQDCNQVDHNDMIAFNATAGEVLATETISVEVVPSFKITFVGLEDGNEVVADAPAHADSVMYGDSYVFAINGLVDCQTGIESVEVDGNTITADANGKFTIADVRENKTVNVAFTLASFAITASTDGNGNANVENANVTCGDTAIITFTPNDGYELATVTDNSQLVSVENNTYIIYGIAEAHEVVATFTEVINPTIAFDSIAPKYAPGFPADVIWRINSEGNPDRMVKVGYEVTRNGQLVERISDYGSLSYGVRLAGTTTFTNDIEYGYGFISERVDPYYIDAFTVGIFDNNTCVNRNRPVELHAEFDSIGEYKVTIKLYDVDTTHALVDLVGSFEDCNGVRHDDKIAISARATNEIVSLTQIINVVPSYAITFEGLAEGNTYETFAPANGDSIMQGDNFIFSLGGTAECQTGIESVATADGAPLTADADGKYTIENVQSDMTVVVTYSYESYAINVTTDGNGEAVATPNPVTCGEDAVITITPNANFEIASVFDGDNDVTASVVDGTLTIENVRAEHNVNVTFRNNALPTIIIDEYAENYAPAYPADIVGHINSNENFDRMVKLGYTITRNGQEIGNIADYGAMSYSVRLAGNAEISKDILTGSGFISETVEYEGVNHAIDAFTVGIFDNNPCANRNRPVTFHAEFDSIGTYVVNVKLYNADTTNAMVENIASFTDCYGVLHNDKIAIDAEALDSVVSVSFTINVVPSYIITFEGLEEGNTYASLDTIHGDTVMMGNNYSFTLDGLAACQTGIASVATDVAVLEAVEGVYTIENVQSDMVVTVTYNHESYAINVETDGNGTAVARPDTVMCGDSVAIYITPNEYYEIATVMDGENDVTTEVMDSMYVIYNVTANHDVTVTFNEVERPYYHVAVEGLDVDNVLVSETGDTVRHGDNYVFGIELTDCQSAIDSVYVGGVVIAPDAAGLYTIENVISDTTVLVTFIYNYYTVNATVADTAAGTVMVMPESVFCGDSAVVYIMPNDNYQIESVMDGDDDVTAAVVTDSTSTYYVINSVTEDHNVVVTLSIINIPEYVITFEGLAEGNTHTSYGTAGNDTVLQGQNYIFSIDSLVECQAAIDSITANGQLLVADDEGLYTIENVQSDVTVVVTFVTPTYTITMTAGEHGSLADTVATANVDCGSDYVVTFIPDEGYELDVITMDGDTVTEGIAGNNLTLTNVTADHIVVASFVAIPPDGPYAEIIGLEDSYASGDSIDFSIKLHADGVLDNLCAVGYQLKIYNNDTTSVVLADATRYGIFTYNVNVTDSTFASNGITTGEGLFNAEAEYNNNTYSISAFTLGLFDSECAGRNRNIDLNAIFSASGRYQFNVSLYTCANGGNAIGTRYEDCEGRVHYDRVDAVCDSMTLINMTTREIEITGDTLFTITATVIGANGSVEPNGTVVVPAGSTYEVVFIPDENYAIDTVRDNGFIRFPVEGSGYIFNNVYTLTNISENHNITVSYRDIRAYYNIHVEVETAGGDVTPRDTTVVDGADVTLVVTPNPGYHISQLEIDGNMVNNCTTNEIIFYNVQADHNVKIAFFPNSIEENAFSDLSVYPNPNNGKFTVSSAEFDGEVTLQLFNASGAAIDERTLTDQEYVDYDRELPTGTYILRIISGDKVATRKIVVE